mmetsp:Transcript_106049/g.184399  ORF Transcript_106049/g.184399 Transcript_106049/m.184399 type:complete len:145 (+) Transcript_106049:1914-2348(+)
MVLRGASWTVTALVVFCFRAVVFTIAPVVVFDPFTTLAVALPLGAKVEFPEVDGAILVFDLGATAVLLGVAAVATVTLVLDLAVTTVALGAVAVVALAFSLVPTDVDVFGWWTTLTLCLSAGPPTPFDVVLTGVAVVGWLTTVA